jgi:hypothetical protein
MLKMPTKKELEQQLLDAQQKLSQIQQDQKPVPMPNTSLADEMAKLRRRTGRTGVNIPVRVIDDHTNVALYTPLNKKIGPMHPRNAEKTMQDWYAAGYPLYTEPRTPEQVEEFKQTDFYKTEHAKHEQRRSERKASSKEGEYERIAKIVANETNRTIDKLTSVPKRD